MSNEIVKCQFLKYVILLLRLYNTGCFIPCSVTSYLIVFIWTLTSPSIE